MSDTQWHPEEVRRRLVLEVVEEFISLHQGSMCNYNTGMTCDEVKGAGSGHCCHEYRGAASMFPDPADLTPYQRSLQDAPF